MTTPTPSKTPRADAGIRVSVYGDVRCDMEVARLLELELNAERATSATLVRDLAAAQEANKRLEACVHGEVPAGALNALGRWLAPVLDEDKWATAEPMLNAALLQLLEAQEARQRAERDINWLYTHCRAIGMVKEADKSAEWPRSIVRDIALFTIDLKERAQAAEARAEQSAKDAERWRYWRANPSKWASAPVETLSSWKTPKQLDRDTDAAIAGEPK